MHKILNKLLNQGKITKTGQPSFVYYQTISKPLPSPIKKSVYKKIEKFIEENYLYISPEGKIYEGIQGFQIWVSKTHQEKFYSKLASEYYQLKNKINKTYQQKELINATFKIKQTFKEKSAIDELFFLDFYSLPKFGETKIGQLVLFAKQSQNLFLIKKLVELSKDKIKNLIKQKRIDALCYIPHIIPRKIQFLKEYQRLLNLQLPQVPLIKIYENRLLVPQKSLTSLEDRIINARETIYIKEITGQFKNILLIDDAVGSGASMNETAKKIKRQINKNSKIFGFALVGSLNKGFDIIKEI